MAKKYFWLKLKEDFFRDKKIKKLRKIAGGDTYTIIYLKMQLLSLKNDGALIFEGVEENFAEEIALEIDEDVDNVKVTIAFLINNGLIEEVEQDHFVMTETIKCIGSESASAERVRKMRAKKRLLGEPEIDEKRYGGNGLKALERDGFKCVKCGSPENVCIHHNNGLSNDLDDLITLCRKCHSNIEQEIKSVTCNTEVTNCNTEIDIEKELELRDKNKVKEIKRKYGEYQNVKLTDKEYQSLISEYGSSTDEIIKYLDEYIEMKGTKYKSCYMAIRKWVANAVKEKKNKSNASNGYKREEIVPDWFNKDVKPKQATTEEQQEIDDILKQYRPNPELQARLKEKYGKGKTNL